MKCRKRVAVQDLRVGMRLVGLDKPWIETPFLRHRMLLRTERQIERIRACGARYAEVEAEESIEERPADSFDAMVATCEEPSEPPDAPAKNHDLVPLTEELTRADEVYCAAKTVLMDAMEDVRMGREVNVSAVAAVVEEIVGSLLRNPEALPSLSQLKTHDEYTFSHSVNVGVLAVAFGRHHGLLQDELLRLGTGALLHDIGKVRVPLEILNKPGRFTRDEYEIMKQHPESGAEILCRTPGITEDEIHPALEHHERGDGTGYPYKKTLTTMNRFGLITQVADIYDAMTSKRVYHQERPPYEVLRYLYTRGQAGQFDFTTVQEFIQCVGIYPVGSLVELDSGERGLVVTVNRNWLLAPQVLLIQDRSGPLNPPYHALDLADQGQSAQRTIAAVLDHSLLRINLADYLMGPYPHRSE